MEYIGSVYRPPSEANSLIIQATVGCSCNACAFCTMYKEKRFYIRREEDIGADLKEISSMRYAHLIKRIFLADGDALIIGTDKLIRILDLCYLYFPACERVTSYASPKSLLLKSENELKELKSHGLAMVYLGLESGSDKVLKLMRKGSSCAEIIEGAKKAREAGIALSVTAISGLGGRDLMDEHAALTAKALSAMDPEYTGLLTLEIFKETPLYDWKKEGKFKMLSADEVLLETRMLLSDVDCPGSIFRMNHASNYLTLAGTLNKDRQALIEKIDDALSGRYKLREEWQRRL